MKTLFSTQIALFLLATIFLAQPIQGIGQSKFSSKNIEIKLTGTSSLHDWEMNADNGISEAQITIGENNKITSLTGLSFTLASKSLKSDHSLMDKNTYKALKADKNPNISFVLSSATLTPAEGNNYNLKCIGKLTIAGTTNETELLATGKYNPADKSFTVTGTKKMRMTDYQVKPPTVMLGTIKTGNDIAITYNIIFTK